MARRYRSWAERRDIIRATIAEATPKRLDEFALTDSEKAYFRDLTEKIVTASTIRSSAFRGYAGLPIARPFSFVVGMSAIIFAGAAIVAGYLIWHRHPNAQPDPLLAACGTIAVAALGWVAAGWITHRNTIRQNTNNILFARFSQAPFGEAIHRFHKYFGWTLSDTVSSDDLDRLRKSGNEEHMRAAASATYILNYFESIASGVLNGDLDKNVVTANVRGFICNYHDKCEPHIRGSNAKNPKTYDHLIKLRRHYLEP